MKGAIADPAVRTISTPKTSKITIAGNNQNFFLWLKKPQRSLMNSIFSYSFLVRFLYVLTCKCVISDNHHRILPGFEFSKFKRIDAEKPSRQSNWRDDAKENQGQKNFGYDSAQKMR